eukprot:96453-Pleurochrysis_carterae.AAC.1
MCIRDSAYLPRAPPQPSRSAHCPTSAMDLLLPQTASKLEAWMRATLGDLASIRDLPPGSKRVRPAPLAIGQSEMHEWARGV